MTILYFIIALGLLVAIHEFGHFAVAKLSGIGVEVFSIGFGPKIIGFRKGETEYRVALIPLGGYVKMVGEDPGDRQAAVLHPDKAYSKKSVWARLATVLAGPAMNLLLAALLLPLVFLVGKKEPVVLQEAPVVMEIIAHSPAAQAGIQVGDRLVSIDGVPTKTWADAVELILLRPEHAVPIEVNRDGEIATYTVPIILDPYSANHIGFLGVEPHYFVGNDPIIGKVMPEMPAEHAGFRADDRIIAINGYSIDRWSDVLATVGASKGQALTVTVERAGEVKRLQVKPLAGSGPSKWVIGIQKKESAQALVLHRYGFTRAVEKGWQELKHLTGLTFHVLKRLFTLQLSYKSLGGPVQIAAASGAAARSGLGEFLYFMAFLSLQLGILNLLPIPVLDGGHVAFMAIEGIIRRDVPLKVKIITQQLGIALLLGLMLLVTANDINSLWGFKKIMESVVNWF